MSEIEEAAPKGQQEVSGDDEDTLTLGNREPLSDEALAIASRPISDIKMMLDRGAYVLKAAEEKLAKATDTYTRKTSKEGFITTQAHQASFGEHGGAMEAARAEAMTAVNEVFAQAKLIQEAVGQDREPVLSDVDAIRANSRREFVKEDMLEAPRLSNVQRSLQSALASGDSVSIYLSHRYAVQRLNAARPEDKADHVSRAACVALVDQMRGMITDKRPAEVQQQAKELRRKALDFQKHLHERVAPTQQRDPRYSGF